MKIKPLIMATLVGVSLIASPITSNAKSKAIDTNHMVKDSAKKYSKITMYDNTKVSVQFVDVSKITKDKKIQRAIKRDIKGVVKESATDFVQKGARIKANYKIHAYKNGIVSMTGYFIEEYKGRYRFITQANFNYQKNDKRDVITPYSVERVGNMKAIESYLKGKNKAKWGVAIGMPKNSAYPYVFNEKRDLIVQYDASDINKTTGTTYETLVPKRIVFK